MVRLIRCMLEALLGLLEELETRRLARKIRRLPPSWRRQEVIERVLLHAWESRAQAGERMPEA